MPPTRSIQLNTKQRTKPTAARIQSGLSETWNDKYEEASSRQNDLVGSIHLRSFFFAGNSQVLARSNTRMCQGGGNGVS